MQDRLDDFIGAYGDGFGYAFDNNIMLNWYPERVISLCPQGGRLLELGLGHGFTTNRFARHFASHLVIDGSPAVIDQFKSKFPDCPARLTHAYFEDFESDQQFDVIIMGFVLEHVEDHELVLRHYRKFLGPNGRCFITVPNAECLHRRFGHAAGMLDDMQTLGTGDRELGHLRLFTVDTLTAALKATGYKIIRKEGIFLKPLTTAQLQALKLDAKIVEAMCAVGIDYPELCAALLFEVKVDLP